MIRETPTFWYFIINIIFSVYAMLKLLITGKYNDKILTQTEGYCYLISYIVAITIILWLMGVF